MTDLESPRKNNDCYFYYYSKCAKGDSCTFRHEPSALGCETMCSFWKEGKCLNVHCNFRHMELRKNRKAIPCYWESQPGGCLKDHCPFLHQTAKPSADDSLENKTDSGTESADNTMTEKLSHVSEKSFKNTPVDSLVVNFEEESDNESAPTNSPQKSNQPVKVKTLEEIKLEKIQAESAAYYSYPEQHLLQQQIPEADDLRQRILDRISSKSLPIRKPDLAVFTRKRPTTTELTPQAKKLKKEADKDVSDIKIKTLEEIRAERAKNGVQNKVDDKPAVSDSCVTSTNEIQEEQEEKVVNRPRRIKLLRKNLSAGPVEMNLPSDEKNSELVEEYEKTDLCEEVDIEMGDSENNKTIDEVLLLQDDDDNSNVSLKDEERLLNADIDDLLEDE